MPMLISWFVLAVSVWIAAKLLPGMQLRGFGGAIWVSALFGLLNFGIGWLLFVMLGLGTLGLGFIFAFLTRWVVDAILLKWTAAISSSLDIDRFRTAFFAALIIAGVGTLGEYAFHAWRR